LLPKNITELFSKFFSGEPNLSSNCLTRSRVSLILSGDLRL